MIRYWPIVFTCVVGSLLVYGTVHASTHPVSHYSCYSRSNPYCWAVEKKESDTAYRMVNLVNGERREWRFCGDEKVNLYPGYVLSELITIEGKCDWIGRPDLHYTIVRDDDWQWHSGPYAYMTHDDFKDFDKTARPVLALNCEDTADDSDVVCTDEIARFPISR